jgi:hypothetical protein
VMGRRKTIDARMWGDAKFRAISPPAPNAQTLWVYLLTGPHATSIPGLFVAGIASMAEALAWPTKAFQKCFEEILSQGMAEFDHVTRVVWIPKAVHYDPPQSPNVVKSWRVYWDQIPECELKVKAYAFLEAFLKGIGKGFEEAFKEGLGEGGKKSTNSISSLLLEEEELVDDTPPSGKASRKSARFTPPSIEEVRAYIAERKSPVDAEKWYAYYVANGWRVGKNPMKNWHASVVYWEREAKKPGMSAKNPPKPEETIEETVARLRREDEERARMRDQK